MSEGTALFTSDQGWTDLFMVGSYAVAVVGLYGGLRKAVAAPSGRVGAVSRELLTFGFFAFMFWVLESWAHFRTPYYGYSFSFHDLLPRARFFEHWGWVEQLPVLCDRCTDFVQKNGPGAKGDLAGTIPLCVILLEASLTYAALWTAKLLNGPVGAQPIFAGLVLVTVDALLDPIVAKGHSCLKGAASPVTGNGLGFWHWYTPQLDDLIYKIDKTKACTVIVGTNVCKVSGMHTLAPYFHIPIFNYAAWLGAPIILVAFANLVGPIRRDWLWPLLKVLYAWLRGQRLPKGPSITHGQVSLLLGVLVPVIYILKAAPAKDLSVSTQYWAMLSAVAVVGGIFINQFGKFQTIDRVDATLVQPVALGLAIPAAAGLTTGQFVERPLLMPVAVIALMVGLWLAWLPYRASLERISKRVGYLDRLTRVHYFGFTTLLTLLGASYYTNNPSNRLVLGLLLVAACFHVFAYVSNDLFDLHLDKKNERRANDPLVLELISVPTATAVVLTTVPIALLTTLLLVELNPAVAARCVAILIAAFLLMTLYNWQGKKFAIPLVTDLAQGLSWGSLAIFGGLVAGAGHTPTASLADVFGRCWILAAYGACFIFLINGIHGGLRDLRNDELHEKSTTAIFLGAQPDAKDPNDKLVLSNWKIMAFAHAVHLIMFGLVAWFLTLEARNEGALKSLWLSVGFAIVAFIVSAFVLQGVVARVSRYRDDFISWHIFVLLVPPVGMFWLTEPPVTAFKVAVAMSFFVPLLLQQDHIHKLINLVYENDGIAGAAQRVLRACMPKRKPDDPVPATALAGDAAGVNVDTDS